MNWYLEVLKKYAVFSGRARRKEYWYFFLFHIIVTTFVAIIDILIGNFDRETGVGILGVIYTLAILVPSIAVTVRRLHDTGRSAWWLLIALIPILGFILLLLLLAQDGKQGPNQYGANPKEAIA